MELLKLTGKDIKPYIKELAKLRIKIFREYPYLYDGDAAYEEKYLHDYSMHESNVCILLIDNSQIVGASTGMWLKHSDKEFQSCFLDKNIPIDNIYYFGEFIVYKSYRGKGAGRMLLEHSEKHAISLGAKTTALCTIERKEKPLPDDSCHPYKPLWRKLGYQPNSNLIIYYKWKEIDEDKASSKPMKFWIKSWDTITL